MLKIQTDMQLICTNLEGFDNPDMIKPEIGTKYTSLGPSKVHPDGVYIKELPKDIYGYKCSYALSLFSPVGGPDEVDTVEARQLDKEREELFAEIASA